METDREESIEEEGFVPHTYHRVKGMTDEASLLQQMVVFGGDPRVGFLTNPETKDHPGFIEVNGEKVVCTAKGGECRQNSKYYTTGLGDAKSWRTPIIDETCPNNCWFKYLVHDNHDETMACPSCTTPYPEHNKFRGQFDSFCMNYDLLEVKKPSPE